MASGGTLWVSVRPSLEGFGADLRRQIEESVPPEIRVRIRPDSDPARQGSDQAGAFAAAYRARLAAALRDLPEIEINADSTDADRELAAIRARLAELRDVEINADFDAGAAVAEINALQARLERLGATSPDVRVRADVGAAAADLAALQAEINRLDGQHVDVDVDVDTTRAISGMSALLTAGLALGPALIPIGAAIAAGLLSIGPAALVGAGALGSLGLAFSGVGAAIGLADKAQTQAGTNAGQAASQQASSASAIASAQDGVASSERSLAQARAQAADGAISAAERVKTAQQSVVSAQQNAAASIRSALQSQVQAEQALADAQRTEQTAQENLTRARKDAAATLQSLTFQGQDNALAQRSAAIQLQQAQAALVAFQRTGGTQLQQDQAELGVDEAQQRVTELRAQGEDLAAQKAEADKRGIEGSTQVTAAQDAITAAVRRTQEAQQSLQNANAAVTKAQTDGQASVLKAEQSLADARRAQAMQQMTSANAIASAEQGVVSAQRALESAQRSATQSTGSAATATNAYKDALAKLSPAAREFVEFYVSTLKPKFDELQATAARGLFPGLQDGIKSAMPLFGQLNTIVGNISTAMGDLARDAGKALTQPFWRDFFDFIGKIAGPTIHDLGVIFGNWSQGLAGIFQALYEPVFVPILNWFKDLSERVKNFSTTPAFKSFLDYVKENGPKVRDLFGALVDIVKKIVEGLAGTGAATLDGLVAVFKAIASLPVPVLTGLVEAFVAIRLALLAQAGIAALTGLFATISGISWAAVGSALGSIAAVAAPVAVAAGLSLASTELDKQNMQWQAGPNGKPTTQAQKSTGQSATNDLVGALHDTVNPQDRFGADPTKWISFDTSKYNFKDSTVGKMLGDIGAAFARFPEEFKNSPFMKWINGFGGMFSDAFRDSKKWLAKTGQDILDGFFGGIGKIGDKIGKFFSDGFNDAVKGVKKLLGIESPSKVFAQIGSDLLQGLVNGIAKIRDSVVKFFTDLWASIRKGITDAWNTITRFFADTWAGIRKTLGDAWNAVTKFLSDTWVNIRRGISEAWNAVVKFLSDTWSNIRRGVDVAWSGITRFFADTWSGISRTVTDTWNGITRFLSDTWNGITRTAQSVWGGLKNIFKDGINGAIDALNWMIRGVDVVLNVVKVPAIPQVPRLEAGGVLGPELLAAGGTVGAGFVTNGPRAIVGEGNPSHPEFVIPTDPQYRSRALQLFESLGGHLMADGGVLGGIGEWLGNTARNLWGGVTAAASSVTGAIGDATKWIGGGAAALLGQIKDAVRGMLPDGLFGDAGAGVAGNVLGGVQKLIEGAYKAMQAAATAYGGGGGAAPPGQVSAWIAQALQILGYPQTYAAGIYQQIMTESGGNPGVTQHGYTDVNTLSGNLAQGIMQVIPPTFRAHMLPGHGNPFNPVDNIIAGSRYAMGRYGAGWFSPGPQHSHGYDSGGMLMPGMTAAFNGTGQPERVLTPAQTASYDQMVAFARDQSLIRSLGAGTNAIDGSRLARAATSGRPQATGDTFHITARDEHAEDRIAAEVQRQRDFRRRTH